MCESKVLHEMKKTLSEHELKMLAERNRPASLVDGLPQCVRVGGFTYAVVPSDEYVQGAESYAVVDHRRLEIRIGVEPPTDPQHVRQALLHEMVHAVAQVYGAGTGEELTEGWVESLSHGLYQALNDNPEAVAFILEAELEGRSF